MFSFGFQQAYQRGFENEDAIYFTTVRISSCLSSDAFVSCCNLRLRDQCLESAKAVIENMINGLAPTGYMRYAPDGK